ncbi:uncharacterized protein LOC130281834 isoform X5 [Hyla sarda]|uniref:uncharacterized protein LOC130281834 isoform X5 n=1 Tax=Hyla sarda TaxID=327740 RepID=UPI0024C2DF8B|nr:uncharacterized protein LOC130281834 isoform X5 [Hyla sarda]
MKKYIKILTLPQYKISKNPIDRLCQQVYLNLVASLHAKMKAWPNKLDNNNLYVKKFEKCLEMINESSLDEESIPPDALIKILISLPWDMKHIFIVTIAEKQFQKKYIPSSVTFFSKIFDILGKKHWALFLDVLERLTEYTLEDYTEGSLKACMEILHSIIIWNLQRGDSKENIAAYFSSPESLSNRTFSKYTDVWMLATTLYSVLLYGRRPFEELSHVNIFDFVNEIKSQHTARKPISIPPDLWNILQTNLDFHATTRTLTEAVLQDLKTYQNNLGPRSHTFYTVTSVSSYINPEEIQRGYVDDTGNYILEETEELEGNSVDSVILQDGYLIQTVTARMSRNTRRQILQLDNENILKINEIKTDFYKTVLLSNAFNGHLLSETNQEVSRDQLFSYFHQITLGLQELHKHNIVLCDLRCSSIYINPNEGTLKIGHVGRAVSLDGISTFPYAMKLMPADASKWSAPEVRDNSMYSKASDIFNLAAVFWEAISLHINTIYQNQPLESFQHCRTHLEEYCHSVSIQNTSEDPVNKLVKCVLKCWNRNPTRRPTLDVILNTIKEITTHNATGCSTAVERIEYFVSEDEEEEEMSEDVYETIIDCSSTDLSSDSSDFYDFSSTGFYVDYAWGSVVREFTLIHVPSNNTRPFIELKETSTYNDIGISPRNKTHSKRGIIL